ICFVVFFFFYKIMAGFLLNLIPDWLFEGLFSPPRRCGLFCSVADRGLFKKSIASSAWMA
ncbi:hypothetical protein ACVGWW_13275, partial [Enterobacter hormaechei]